MRLQKEVIWVLLIGLLILAIIIGLEWRKVDQRKKPKSLVTTFIDDAKTSRAFTWYTDNSNVASILQIVKGSALKFDSEKVTTITGMTTTIASSQQIQGVHKVKVSNLEPGTTYSYRVGSGEDKDWSKPAIFMTEAEALDEFTFINVADSQGITEEDFILWGKTLNKAFEIFPAAQFIIHNGDLTEDSDDDNAWDYFFREADPWVSQIPIMPVTGNHDEVDGVADHFTSHFNLPNNGAKNSTEGTSYSFDYGSAHIVVLNTESNMKEQTTWLEEDLTATELPWKIVAMHRGAYGGNMNKKVDDWVALFDKYEVDLVLQGHNHEYSRSYPLRNGEVVGDGDHMINDHEGTVYVVTNTAGQKFNEKKEDQFYHQVHFQNEKQMFAGIQIKGDSLVFQAYDRDGEKLDEFVIQH